MVFFFKLVFFVFFSCSCRKFALSRLRWLVACSLTSAVWCRPRDDERRLTISVRLPGALETQTYIRPQVFYNHYNFFVVVFKSTSIVSHTNDFCTHYYGVRSSVNKLLRRKITHKKMKRETCVQQTIVSGARQTRQLCDDD